MSTLNVFCTQDVIGRTSCNHKAFPTICCHYDCLATPTAFCPAYRERGAYPLAVRGVFRYNGIASILAQLVMQESEGDHMSLKAKAKRLLPFAALFPALLVTAWLWANLPEEHYVSVYSGSGIWDLRGFDFANATASLHGPVEYIAASFLMPKEFAAREGEISRRYPGIRSETATVRVRFIVPSDGYYIITRISTGFADRIYLNGEWLRNIGSPEYGAGDVLLSDIFHFKARPENGVIELQSQQSNFIYHVRAYRDGLLEELVYGNAYQRVAYTQYCAWHFSGYGGGFAAAVFVFPKLQPPRLAFRIDVYCVAFVYRRNGFKAICDNSALVRRFPANTPYVYRHTCDRHIDRRYYMRIVPGVFT